MMKNNCKERFKKTEKEQKPLSVYIHIPFCQKKCLYCNFSSYENEFNEVDKYFDFLWQEIKDKSQTFCSHKVKTIYFGGGTPSSVQATKIIETLNLLKKLYKFDARAEITIEVNPFSASKDKLLQYKNAGFNRLSIGVQSLNSEELIALGRLHNAQQAKDIVCVAKELGFNVSCDVMMGIPNQTQESLQDTLVTLAKFDIDHISAYLLICEKGTPLTKSVNAKQVILPSEEMCADMFKLTDKILKQYGYNKYEISAFCKKGKESKHNLNYWLMGEYVGFGLSAHSFYGGYRYANATNFERYYSGKVKKEKITFNKMIEESVMLGLRTTKGINIDKLLNQGYDLVKEKEEEIQMLKKHGFVILSGKFLRATKKGSLVLNGIIDKLI